MRDLAFVSSALSLTALVGDLFSHGLIPAVQVHRAGWGGCGVDWGDEADDVVLAWSGWVVELVCAWTAVS
jgi:hypothetical protein